MSVIVVQRKRKKVTYVQSSESESEEVEITYPCRAEDCDREFSSVKERE